MKQDDLTLYGITDELSALDEMLEMDRGEIDDTFEQMEEKVYDLLTTKVDAICGYDQKLDDMIALAKQQKDRLQKFIQQKENKKANLKYYAHLCLSRLGQKEFRGSLYEIKAKKPAKVLEIKDESKIPTQFLEFERKTKILREDLKKAVKAGTVSIEGVSLVDGKKTVSFGLRKEQRKDKNDG